MLHMRLSDYRAVGLAILSILTQSLSPGSCWILQVELYLIFDIEKMTFEIILSAWGFQLVLQDNVKEVFDSVLDHERVPLVVHYLFGVLENLANKNGVEPDTLLCWKSER